MKLTADQLSLLRCAAIHYVKQQAPLSEEFWRAYEAYLLMVDAHRMSQGSGEVELTVQ